MNETVADLLGLAGWVVGIVFVLALCRAAAMGDEMERRRDGAEGMNNHYGLAHCPVTGKERTDKYKQSWSDRSPFDSCPQCAPEGYVPMGTRLRRLETAREREAATDGLV